jgi:hypothetical protein
MSYIMNGSKSYVIEKKGHVIKVARPRSGSEK